MIFSNLESFIPKLEEKNDFLNWRRPSKSVGDINIKKEDKFLQIDGSYSLKAIDENYLEKIRNNIGGESSNYNNFYYIISEILKKINTPFEDVFDYSLKLAKKLNVEKDLVELFIDKLLKLNQSVNLEILYLNNSNLTIIGKILSYAYNKLDDYKIRNYQTLTKLVEKASSMDVNIFTDYLVWCTSQNKDPNKYKFMTFCKKQKKNYEFPPQILVLLNTYQNITTLIFELDDLKDEDCKFFELAVLNLHWILKKLSNIKFNFISKRIEKFLFNRQREKFVSFCGKINSTFKPMDTFFNDISYLIQKWDFSSKLKLYNKNEKLNTEKLFDDTFSDNNSTRIDILQKNANLFEYILICFFSLNFYNNINMSFELVMNNCYNTEFYLMLTEIYKFEFAQKNFHLFHIFDTLLFNNLIKNIKTFNTEINCLDNRSFKKIIDFLYYSGTINNFNISLFTTDLNYIPQYLYMIYSQSFENQASEIVNNQLKNDFDENTYLFRDIKEIDDKILDKLYNYFVANLATLFEIIKSKNSLNELGFNFDVPFNIRMKNKYMNAIFKFLLNLLFYVSKHKLKKFCFISPYTTFDPVKSPGIDKLIENIDLKKNKYYEELTLQMQFYNMDSITSFLNSRIINLNLGNMDLYTFKSFCNFISKYEFNKSSSLNQLTIGLMGNINEFTDEIKILFRKLFGIKLNYLSTLKLYTGLCLTDKNKYSELLDIINYNWIIKYLITFDDSSTSICKQESNRLLKIRCLVPIFWERKLEAFKFKKHRNNIKEIEHEIIWYLKYLFNNKYKSYEPYMPSKPSKISKPVPKKEEMVKKMIFDIFKYLYINQIPIVIHDDKNKINF